MTALAWAAPAGAAVPNGHPPLTLDMLRQRLANPMQREGRVAFDLRNFTIDLRADSALTANFYRLLSSALQKPATTPVLDISYATVLGDFDLQRLGQREPLFGDTLAPLLDAEGQAQLRRDRQRLAQLSRLSQSLLIQADSPPQQIYLFKGPLIAVQTRFSGAVVGNEIYFLGRFLAQGAMFEQGVYLSGARFNRELNLVGADFRQGVQAKSTIFFAPVRLDQSRFRNGLTVQGAEFKVNANFSGAQLAGDLNFSRVQWQGTADFARTLWEGTAFFLRGSFSQALFFTEARFEAPLILRQARFSQPVNLRNAMLNREADFGDALFQPQAYLNVAGLEFSIEQTQILGTPGKIGRVFSVSQLRGNETLLRNLERNFRRLEQISDANHIAYTAERLRLKDWRRRLLGMNLNSASVRALTQTGFTTAQAQAIAARRLTQPFLSVDDVLNVEGVDLAAYVKVKDHVLARNSYSVLNRVNLALRWLGLSELIVLSHYGTSFGLIFGVGLVAIPVFTLMFWFVDRYRRRVPSPILPPLAEGLWLAGSCGLLLLLGLSNLLRLADYPWLTLVSLGMLIFPVPLVLIGLLLRQGRFHDLMEESYFVEDGSLRQLRLLIARLPIIPKFPFFRDRYTPILLNRRWNWLNYLDFSLNNWLKFGFNDVRLRDQHVPGLISALVWYQWGLGLLYAALLLWTLSRTIPGLNLLLYF
ncbi:MAG: pentapeptide repeat-containing protein [Leptolyngbyaceae cyanobacterium SM2_5_2]|nr:pentapeptide repeat-containing protein [Leptolyngbyaceae cyanobacterium SM2_5_2]